MPFPKPIDSTLHGVTDYTAGTMLMTALPRLTGLAGTRSGRQLRIAGAIHAGYSTITDYPVGAVKLIPYRVHLALDAIGAVALAAAPFVGGHFRRGPRHWVPHVALALVEAGALALSDPTGRGAWHGDLDAVRAANTEDPHRKVHESRPAVVAAVA